ncbi:hypothetical protein GOP47_0016563 [Adiantum capillus-veneris]|uniref:Kinetochore protein Nuf2 N-terminal domain-containing protein n=1 Tax=Adiantum capillus-veneris TaxID=13818 RepID=A0A9D4UHW4_ADICA|nr:hypothetical protein GOP47_0016563 [Adiantum capillus-veneris]
MSNFSFPILTKEQICSHLAELGAPKLSIENLISPNPEALLPVYDFLASFCLSPEIREESMQLGFPSVQMLGDHPELYSEAHANLKLYDCLSQFMKNAGVQDFSVLKDLYRPESLRTIRFLSAAINFIMFWVQKQNLITQLKSARDEELAKLEDLHSEESKIQFEIAQIEQERVAKHPQVEALEGEIKELNMQLKSLNKQQQGLKADLTNLKQEDGSKLDKISNLEFEIMQKKQQGDHLRSQILENPQELQKIVHEKETALAEEEALRRNVLEIADVWKAKVAVLEKAEKKVSKLLALTLTVEEQAKKSDMERKVLKERKARQKAIEKESWACDAKRDELIWGVRRLEELAHKTDNDCSSGSKELEDVKRKQAECRIEHDARYLAVKELDMQTETRLKISADLINKKEVMIAKLQDVSDRAFKAIQKYAEATTPSAEMQVDMEIQRPSTR